MSPELVALEQAVKAGDHARGSTLAIELYGDELFGYLSAVAGDPAADDVYSQLCEDLWRGLPGFSFRSSIRTWLYVLARHALHRYRRSPWNHKDRRTGSDVLDALMARPRSQTAPWQRTEVKTQFRALREALDVDDQTLLVLRIDRDLSWKDIARVMADDARDTVDDEALARDAARLRKRFQHLKTELTERAIAAGLVVREGLP